MIYQYTWLIWSSAFLLPWAALYALFPAHRSVMWRASLVTSLMGLSEPIFVPEYWSPPSLFDLAQRTGFDIESLIFCFAIGGVGAVLYNIITGQDLVPMSEAEKRYPKHRFHPVALVAPFIAFVPLYFLSWNPIYAGISALLTGAIASIICRPDLKLKTFVGGVLFLGYYSVFMVGLLWGAPGYIERVWNLDAISGVLVYGIPVEEFLFGFAFGLYWAGVYEHFTWKRTQDTAYMGSVPT